MPLDREKAKARRVKVVDLSDLLGEGQSVIVQSMTVGELALFEMMLTDEEGETIPERLQTARERVVVMTAVDVNGTRLFSEADIPELTTWNAAVLDRIYRVANALSGRQLPKEKKVELEQIAGN